MQCTFLERLWIYAGEGRTFYRLLGFGTHGNIIYFDFNS